MSSVETRPREALRDLTLTGHRLHVLCTWLDEQKAVRLQVEDARFANLHGSQPFVTGIAITTASTA